MNTKLKDLSLLDASDFLKAPGSLDTSDNESFDVMGESRSVQAQTAIALGDRG